MNSDLPNNPVVIEACKLLEHRGAEALRMESSAVVTITKSEEGGGELKSLSALVAVSDESFEVQVEVEGQGLAFRCSCRAKGGCAHALLALCKSQSMNLAQLQEAWGAALSSAASSRAGAVAPKQMQSSSAMDLVETVTQRLARALSPEEESYLGKVCKFFTKHAEARQLSADGVNMMLPKKPIAQWELVTIWPRKPLSDWQAWLYLSVFMKNRGEPIPAFLEKVTTQAEIVGLAGEWERQQALQAWEDNLEKMVGDMEALEGRTNLEARLLVGKEAVRLQWMQRGDEDWKQPFDSEYLDLAQQWGAGKVDCTDEVRVLMDAFLEVSPSHAYVGFTRAETRDQLARLLLHPLLEDLIFSVSGEPFTRSLRRLKWRLQRESAEPCDYLLELVFENGELPAPPLFTVGGNLNCFVTEEAVYRTPPLLRFDLRAPIRIPADGLYSPQAVRLLSGLRVPLPDDVSQRVVQIDPVVRLRCWLEARAGEERLCVQAKAELGGYGEQFYGRLGWEQSSASPRADGRIVSLNQTLIKRVPELLSDLALRDFRADDESWVRIIGKRFPEEFSSWVESLPKNIHLELEGELLSLKDAVVRGAVQLEVKESAPDWFDLHVALSVSDTELSKEEIQLLLEARGKFVRLKGKGWRRLEFDMSDEESAELSELGLNPSEFNGPPQRYHALQLAASPAQRLLEQKAREGIRRRAAELQVRVTPDVSSAISAQMRPYQVEGYHFLSYLSTNSFGGILADDMGLGKTLQTLAWIAWLREQPSFDGRPVLVVCPKSVVQNWLIESERFMPGLRALIWRGGDSNDLRRTVAKADLIVINYAQLRISAEPLTARVWHAIVLDEAQYIKNPASQTAVAACALQGTHRLALSGTPIENRLMDLWSIMQFAMPGLLGLRAHFQKQYDSRTDALARRRLAARVRPFVLRRTKNEVARDLPARIEEDLVVEMEGKQKLLYTAELKRARQSLLKIKTTKELDKDRFNVLTSLLRLRQICCHPGLVSDEHGYVDSAKLEALIDLLEPLVEQGHKVLVFSQFVEMLEKVEREIDARDWTSFMLTGETENRGDLVQDFQNHDGAAVFLISLRAGGMGLNLTAASYVVLFDPWWNPAVENQAIDRTHRIGQTQQVIAYRLVAKDSIEEKIRQLQRSKSAMAGDILGEESFAKALTLDDFHFLMED